MSELKSCPFCEDSLVAIGEEGTPVCNECGATTFSVEHWNQRTLPSGVQAVVDAAREIVEKTDRSSGCTNGPELTHVWLTVKRLNKLTDAIKALDKEVE